MTDSQQQALKGPDLTQGIAADSLTDGQLVTGHVGDDAVLLVRRGNEHFAIGATCTHYGGPLAEGLIVGDTVRCPWHHACFSLRTGQALRAPALDGLACWRTQAAGGRVIVLGRRETAAAPASPAAKPEAGSTGTASDLSLTAFAGTVAPSRAGLAVAPQTSLPPPGRIVIVGGGAAGLAAAQRLRDLGFDGSLTMLSDDSARP